MILIQRRARMSKSDGDKTGQARGRIYIQRSKPVRNRRLAAERKRQSINTSLLEEAAQNKQPSASRRDADANKHPALRRHDRPLCSAGSVTNTGFL